MPTFTTADGLDVYFEVRGEGPNLLYCNGSGATLASAAPILDALAADFRVVAHDQRGLGKTGIPPSPPTMADYAADALALLDHVGWASSLVLGISFGGMVALELAATAPERVERLALLCTSAGGACGSSYPLHDLQDLPGEERVARLTLLLDARFTSDWLEEHPGDRFLADLMVQRLAGDHADEQARGEALQLEARKGHDVCDRLGRIDCPTFVGCGRYDGIAPPSNSEAIVAGVPHAELHTYEGGHLFFLQDQRALPDAMAFLAASG